MNRTSVALPGSFPPRPRRASASPDWVRPEPPSMTAASTSDRVRPSGPTSRRSGSGTVRVRPVTSRGAISTGRARSARSTGTSAPAGTRTSSTRVSWPVWRTVSRTGPAGRSERAYRPAESATAVRRPPGPHASTTAKLRARRSPWNTPRTTPEMEPRSAIRVSWAAVGPGSAVRTPRRAMAARAIHGRAAPGRGPATTDRGAAGNRRRSMGLSGAECGTGCRRRPVRPPGRKRRGSRRRAARTYVRPRPAWRT